MCVFWVHQVNVFFCQQTKQHHTNVLHTVTHKHTILHVYLIGVSNSEIKKEKKKKIKATVTSNPTTDYVSLELHIII